MVEYDVFTKYLLGTQVPLGNQGLRHSVTRHFGTNFALSVCPKKRHQYNMFLSRF